MLEMSDYELVTIISPEVDGEKLPEIIDNLGKLITDRGGVVESAEQWGMRKLAYPIKKCMDANYILTKFKLEPNLTKQLNAELKASEEILRHLIVKREG
ncbi:MAG: 30S ribosomal protein S6 [Chloroflexi bacterium CG_4_10_14_0_8_um_filter_46_9]|nr:MAG: 30S ribosomal protein S6 [Chloroflexi bacterium CG15_BIG_FIL_POST_REV_8_21_14_020_46_15]PIZ26867.1 MAG: 30S ribosomal protein S6 [Chloroflexi bacterium CG_4_10_14_0_8_um_filter_46_9]